MEGQKPFFWGENQGNYLVIWSSPKSIFGILWQKTIFFWGGAMESPHTTASRAFTLQDSKFPGEKLNVCVDATPFMDVK